MDFHSLADDINAKENQQVQIQGSTSPAGQTYMLQRQEVLACETTIDLLLSCCH